MNAVRTMLLLSLTLPVGALAQDPPPDPDEIYALEVLGAHNNQGRGCAGCHAPHASETAVTPGETGFIVVQQSLWGQDPSPLYGHVVAFGSGGKYTEVLPSDGSMENPEVGGVLVCLSCHDGNLTRANMMTNETYEQRVGLVSNTAYGPRPAPTLLGDDGSVAGNYLNDHPVGPLAMIEPRSGLVNNNGRLEVRPGTPYAAFVQNYGWPSLAPGRLSKPYGLTPTKEPFVMCTTCHNQHAMNIYTSSDLSPIGGDVSGRRFPTFFFVNGPYNVNRQNIGTSTASTTTQFCRQCHFESSNEANNSFAVSTVW